MSIIDPLAKIYEEICKNNKISPEDIAYNASLVEARKKLSKRVSLGQAVLASMEQINDICQSTGADPTHLVETLHSVIDADSRLLARIEE